MKKILAGLLLALGLLSTPVDAQCVNCGSGGSGGGGGGGSGTVTDVSVVTGNGFAGSVATSTTTPAITLTTTVTGVVCGNGTALSACSAGSGVPGGSNTQLQYNNAGSFGGITGATTNGTFVTLTTPVLGAATGTSLALGGATLGGNALAVTGTANISGATTALNFAASGNGSSSTPAFGEGSSGIYFAGSGSDIYFTRGGTYGLGLLTSSVQVPAAYKFGFESGGAASALDVILARDAANTLAQVNGANAQTFNLYSTFTNSSNYRRISLVGNYLAGGSPAIVATGLGTGANASLLIAADDTSGAISFRTANSARWGIDSTGKLSNTSITLGDQAQVFAVTATQPTTPTGTQNAIFWNITSAGSASQTNRAFLVNYNSGYTGSSASEAFSVVSTVAGTASALISAAGNSFSVGNTALVGGMSSTTTGLNIGFQGQAIGGNINAAIVGLAQNAKNSATNIGGVFSAINTGTSPVMIGVFASLNQTAVPSVSAALIADNGAQTSPIFLARDNGSTVFTIADGGVVTATASITAAGLNVFSTTVGVRSSALASIDATVASITGASPYIGAVATASADALGLVGYGNNASGTNLTFLKTRAATDAATTIVQSGDTILNIRGDGADGTAYRLAGQIALKVDGTPGASDMPGRWEFLTTPDGSATPTLALTINNAQHLLLAAPSTDAAKTTATLCRDTTTGEIYTGSGTIGICLGTSSARYKNSIMPATEGLTELAKLEPRHFRYNKGYIDDGAREQSGFIAEEVADVLPGLVGLDVEGRPNTVDLVGMIPVIIKAIQELKADNDNLRTELKMRRAANGG